jgi:hypothetical protein
MTKQFVPALLLAAAACGAAQAADPVLGFEFGAGYNLLNDSRISGISTNFGLVIPVGTRLDAILYHEQGRLSVDQEEAANDGSLRTQINELRFRAGIYQNETASVTAKVLFGFGYGEYTFTSTSDDGTTEGPVADLGIDVGFLKATTGPVHTELGVTLNYRYSEISDRNVANNGADQLSDLGGFQLGLRVGASF